MDFRNNSVVCTQDSTLMGTKKLKKQEPGELLDVTSLHPLSPEVISRQATINIGTIGHVAHGKSTVVRALTGVKTGRFRSEQQRNQTIKLGYANAKIYKCENEECPRPLCFRAFASSKGEKPPCEVDHCTGKLKLLRHVSFVDCPGHDKYMATMLSGTGVMDGAILVAAANENFPQPQTAEHLAAIDILGLNDVIILQNKVDLVKQEAARKQHKEITNYCQDTVASGAPIIPVCAEQKLNMDVLCEYIVTKIPVPEKDFVSPPFMTIIRSFDVNKPGAGIHEIQGGVLGGTILKGVLKLNQIIEIRPGLIVTDKSGTRMCNPLYSRIVSLKAEQNELQFAVPGGLIGVGTTLDPCLARGDRLVGQVVGAVGSLPDVYSTIEVSYSLLSRLVGVETKEKVKPAKVTAPKKNEILLLNIGSMSTKGVIAAAKNDLLMLQLQTPVCGRKGDKIAFSRQVEGHWRLIGWGRIQAGTIIEVVPSAPYEFN